ncbi:hypothetical protein RRSWK_05874 [Rhodopirellula sp. SWK7]|nr:hypothetical protein RRSWK_05874 [Rhodopirellula sp. SWK7]
MYHFWWHHNRVSRPNPYSPQESFKINDRFDRYHDGTTLSCLEARI